MGAEKGLKERYEDGQSAEGAMQKDIEEVDRQVQAFGIEAPATCRGGAESEIATPQIEEVQVDAMEAQQNAGDEGETSEAAEKPQAAEIVEGATAAEAQEDKSAPSSFADGAALDDAQTKVPIDYVQMPAAAAAAATGSIKVCCRQASDRSTD